MARLGQSVAEGAIRGHRWLHDRAGSPRCGRGMGREGGSKIFGELGMPEQELPNGPPKKPILASGDGLTPSRDLFRQDNAYFEKQPACQTGGYVPRSPWRDKVSTARATSFLQ